MGKTRTDRAAAKIAWTRHATHGYQIARLFVLAGVAVSDLPLPSVGRSRAAAAGPAPGR
jgi:hypothetical protein